MKDIRVNLANALEALKKIEDEIKPPPELRLTSDDAISKVANAKSPQEVIDAIPWFFTDDEKK